MAGPKRTSISTILLATDVVLKCLASLPHGPIACPCLCFLACTVLYQIDSSKAPRPSHITSIGVPASIMGRNGMHGTCERGHFYSSVQMCTCTVWKNCRSAYISYYIQQTRTAHISAVATEKGRVEFLFSSPFWMEIAEVILTR